MAQPGAETEQGINQSNQSGVLLLSRRRHTRESSILETIPLSSSSWILFSIFVFSILILLDRPPALLEADVQQLQVELPGHITQLLNLLSHFPQLPLLLLLSLLLPAHSAAIPGIHAFLSASLLGGSVSLSGRILLRRYQLI
jgi:hypothetical protein